jgi:hypothetical protein
MGLVAAWYLRPSQLEVYEFAKKINEPFIEASRQWGKTTTVLSLVLEELRTFKRNGNVKSAFWFEPNKNQARDIIQPEMDNMQRDCPSKYRFKWRTTDSYYEGPNGSRLYIRGVNEDKGESSRGKHTDIIVADEFGSWRDPNYVLEQVLRPMLLTTGGPLITVSTPPPDLGHLYYAMKHRALIENRFIQKTIYDNEALSQDRIEEIKSQCGGAHTAAWRREYLCEAVTEPERLVIPEYNSDVHEIEDDTQYPQAFDTYVGMDLGYNDHTAIIFSYYDFLNRTLVIDDELLVNGANSQEITEKAKLKERSLWGPRPPTKRICDNDIQQIYDMATMCGYQVLPTRKDEKLAAINALRVRFSQGKIKIKKRCTTLRYQLKTGIWNERRTDFQRSAGRGHLDAIAALVYLNRNIDEHLNPYSAPRYDQFHQMVVSRDKELKKDEQVMSELFAPFKKALW